MKKMHLVLCWLLMIPLLSKADEAKELPSTIKYVTVFRQGAQVSREAKTNLPAGRSAVKFTGISPNIDQQSIQVKADGNFTILSVNPQTNYFEAPEKTDEIDQLEKERAALKEESQREEAMLKVLQEEEAFILANQSIRGNTHGVNPDQLKTIADFYRSRFTEIKLKRLAINKAIRTFKERIAKINRQLQELNAQLGSYTSEVVVEIDAKTATAAQFVLSYIVRNAGWFPNYDIRVKDVKSPILLDYKANVYQTSGEDWNKVKLRLSTGDPSQSGTKPELQPWYVSFYTYAAQYADDEYRVGAVQSSVITGGSIISGTVTDEYGEPLIGANVIVEGTSTGSVTDLEGRYTLQLPYGQSNYRLIFSYTGYSNISVPASPGTMNVVMQEGALLEEVVVRSSGANKIRRKLKERKERKKTQAATIPVPVETVQNTTTFEFKINTPYTIPTDGKKRTVNVQQHDVPAYYEYYCIPKLDLDAFLTARVTDWEDYQLLSGEANLFFEGTFIGKSLLDVDQLSDTLLLSLGRDKNIVIQRKKQKEFSKQQLIGNKKTDTRAWEIEIRNKKKQAVNLIIEDQIPIPSNDKIEIKHEIKNGGILDKNKGLIKWRRELGPGQQEKLYFRYEVKYPKKEQISLE
ncbi:MAG: mucoidy inhibitor MuiA family protein [Bacteroidota bacterium]